MASLNSSNLLISLFITYMILGWARCAFFLNYWFFKWTLLGCKPKLASRIDLLLNKIQLVGIHIKLPTKVSSLDFYRLRLPKLPLKIRQNYLVRACLVTVNSWTQPHGILRSPQWGNIDQVSELTWSSRLKNAKTLKVLSRWELREGAWTSR